MPKANGKLSFEPEEKIFEFKEVLNTKRALNKKNKIEFIVFIDVFIKGSLEERRKRMGITKKEFEMKKKLIDLQHKYKIHKKIINLSNRTLIILLVISIFSIILLGILIPAYMSATSFITISDEVNNTGGYYKLGGYYRASTDEIVVFEKEGTFAYKVIYAHEKCHQQQNYEGRLYYDFWGGFYNELECYIKQWFFWNWENGSDSKKSAD